MIPAECFCIKAGSAVYPEDKCFDMEPERPRRKKHSRRKKRLKREREAKYRNHLKMLALGKFTQYAGAYYADWFPKPYYVRYWRSSQRSRFQYWKKYSNGYVRRYKGEIHKGCAYKKIFDYWWTVD
ncbi:MAG: hypothetical protein HDR04_20575 [Lachnospiraceae bacterium]|nr:hypothetical protein [Lachnospiraceae bacterium]